MQRTTMDKVIDTMGRFVHAEHALDRDRVTEEFRRTVKRTPSVSLLLLSTSDGHAIANWSRGSSDPRRLAAMANTFLTLGETMAKELGMSSADYATICTQQGNVVLIRIDGTSPMTLAAMDDAHSSMALLLYATRECATRIHALLPTPS